ncbi:hypothetical protein DICPUDRAFT_156759 [Dictyostelium purpureum]|uniref:Glutamyl-tRNA(Gln) amidotransferase subunit B, mitochondrial n=1 Tax=Dictyostelium purpureum TaxID=5786 RepID=F0ZXD0_DICPU|nr:uncharacterized protein DICPUDRAFT_156759 [Dictyostelium purpureum]EGC31402.1 hypothetical protein DICPUDRAFT_156759 [Dictyostelium purpureum]|eukprot:XP_003292072.1 hypothetical protein DICPUDRAFT_156759 [Dictyostelium purpureum]
MIINNLNKLNKFNSFQRYYSLQTSVKLNDTSNSNNSNGNKNNIKYIVKNNNDYLKSNKTGDLWELIVGIEVHAQTKTKEKLFSNSLNIGSMEGFKANSRVSYVDAAFPGSLPVLNEKCVEQAIKTGLAIGGKINKYSYFDRKHYFYQDLPQGYQITQLNAPIVQGGQLILDLKDNRKHKINISHIQLEQDSGKSIHDLHPTKSLVDLNRAGIGLMEIVSQPDFTSSEQVGLYITQLQHLLKHIGSSDANMQFGELRCDVNISVHKPDTPLGTRVEIKNMISAKAIVSSIDAEAARQIEILENGDIIKRETRGFNQDSGETFHLRTKEDEVDYRFFPDPDLPPLITSEETIERLKNQIGELPQEMRDRLIKQYDISLYDANILVNDHKAAKFFEQCISFGGTKRDPKKLLTWILRDIYKWSNSNNVTDFSTININVETLTQIYDLVESGYVSMNPAKEILEMILNGDKRSPKEIVDHLGVSQISDHQLLEELCRKLVDAHPNEVKDYHEGKIRLFKFFVGQIMKETKGRSNPEIVNNYIKKYLDLKKDN